MQFGLLVAPDSSGVASGSLYWDDGESYDSIELNKYNFYEFEYSDLGSESDLRLKVKQNRYNSFATLKNIRIFNARNRPLQIQIDALTIQNSLYSFNSSNLVLEISNLTLDLNKEHYIRIRFSL